MYSNCYCSCSFEAEILKICQSSHKIYSNNILNFQESTTILNTHTKKVWKLIVCLSYYKEIYICYFVSFQNVQQESLAIIVTVHVIALTIPSVIKQMGDAPIENVQKDTQENIADQVRKLNL